MVNPTATVRLPVQRTVAQRSLDHGRLHQVLVRWEGLPYSDCTWEDRAKIDAAAPGALEQLVHREVSSLQAFFVAFAGAVHKLRYTTGADLCWRFFAGWYATSISS
jgi:Chromo (CHRromatin Organisation MOdifier) domain